MEASAYVLLGIMEMWGSCEERLQVAILHFKKARAIFNLVGITDMAKQMESKISVCTTIGPVAHNDSGASTSIFCRRTCGAWSSYICRRTCGASTVLVAGVHVGLSTSIICRRTLGASTSNICRPTCGASTPTTTWGWGTTRVGTTQTWWSSSGML